MDMAQRSRTGGKASDVKARKATRKRRRTAPARARRKHHLILDKQEQPVRDFNELKEARQQQAATAEILKVINGSKGDPAPVFDIILEKAHSLCGVAIGSLQLYYGDHMRAVAVRGTTVAFEEFLRRGYRVTDRLRQGFNPDRAVHSADLTQVLARMPDLAVIRAAVELGGIRTALTIPLVKDGTVLGRIVAARQEVRPFSDHQIALLQNFADQAVIAIENARLFNETQAKSRDLTEALSYQTGSSNILKVIATSPTDVGPVLKAIVESACELCGADDAVTHLREGDHLCTAAHHGPIPVGMDRRPINRNFTSGRAAIDKIAIHVHDVLSIEGDDLPEAQEMSRRVGIRTILCVPLLRERESIGTILLRRTEVAPFSDKQIALLRTFADQAVIAIENARLFNETRDALERQTATSEVLKVISSFPGELGPVFDTILENAVRICDAKFGNLLLVDGDCARWAAGVGTPLELAQYLQSPSFRPTPGSHLDRVMQTKRVSHSVDDTAEAVIGASARLGGARSTVCVPMVKDEALVGAIFIYRTEVRPFTDKQIDIVENFAGQAVIAIENTRLLNELRQRTDDLTRSLEDLRAAQDRLIQTEKLASLGQLTAGIAHEIKNPLNFVSNFSAVSAELTDELQDVLQQERLSDKGREEVDELTRLLKDNLAKVVQHGKRADSIVRNMLLHSREGSGERRSADINALVGESLSLAYHGARAEKAGFNITLKQDLDPEAGAADLYPQEITRALLNLISNGFYAATRRKAEAGDESFKPVLCAVTRNLGRTFEIRIRDNGSGVPPEVREKMFNPFFTTKPPGEGTGLGLSMTHDIIVKQHGGRIDVETEPGVFTEFIVTLPRDGGTAAGRKAE
jgi:two-component system NtrC family sensor kinase